MEDPATERERRGRHAARRSAPTGPLGGVTDRLAGIAAAALGTLSRLLDRLRSGPVLPWVSAHRILVLVAVAVLVSGVAFVGTAAFIANPPGAVADGERGDGPRPRPSPGSDFVMPAPTTGAPTATPTPTPPATTVPGTPAEDQPGDPVATAEPDAPVATTEPTEEPTGNGRPDPPGATNRPDKKKD